MSATETTPQDQSSEQLPKWLSSLTTKATKAWAVSEGKLADYTLSLIAFGNVLNESYKEHIAHDLKPEVFYTWAFEVCGKARSTIDQYRKAASVFPTLDERWQTVGQIPQVVELATLDRVSDPTERNAILTQVHDRTEPVFAEGKSAKAGDQPIADTEQAVRVLATRSAEASLTDEQRAAKEKGRAKAQDTAAKRLMDEIRKETREAHDRIVSSEPDLHLAVTLALSIGANIGQDHGTRTGPRVSKAITLILSETDEGGEALTDEEQADLAASLAEGQPVAS